MNIEGGEKAALRGALKVIVDQKPALAISICHSLDDISDIPLMIKNLNIGYDLYLGHHATFSYHEVVCYAIPSM